jgi:acyl dehydratase
MRWFEDYQVGQKKRFGAYEVTREEVLDFARRYDPQPFHLDDEAAAQNRIFGRLAASGWHTAAMVMRMVVDNLTEDGHFSLGSPGLDELTWLKPVYPGDTLSVEVEVTAVKASRSKPEIGFVSSTTTAYNQHGEAVMRQRASNMQPTRPKSE